MKLNILRQYRLFHGLTQQALAELLDTNQATVSNWETGKKMPSAWSRRKLRELTGDDDLVRDLIRDMLKEEEVHNG